MRDIDIRKKENFFFRSLGAGSEDVDAELMMMVMMMNYMMMMLMLMMSSGGVL